MMTNLACSISRLRGGMGLLYGSEITTLHHRQTRSHGTEGWKDASEDNKLTIVQYATFSKSLNLRNIGKSVADIRIRFQFESSFWISVSSCKLTILPDIQPANRIMIISGDDQWCTGSGFWRPIWPDIWIFLDLDWISFPFQPDPDPDYPNKIKCGHAKSLDME